MSTKKKKQAVEILPALLAMIARQYTEQATRAQDLGPWVHVDFMDNSLVKGKTVPASVIVKQKTSQKREMHLMVKKPEKYIDAFLAAGIDRFILHVESDGEKDAIIQRVKNEGREVILAVLDTSIIYPARPYLKDVDGITIMTVKAGKFGQRFLPDMLEKVRLVRSWYPDFPIEVDGGVTAKTAVSAVENGASRLAIHSALFNAKNPASFRAKLQEIVDRVQPKIEERT